MGVRVDFLHFSDLSGLRAADSAHTRPPEVRRIPSRRLPAIRDFTTFP